MTHLLDTNLLIDHLRAKGRRSALFGRLQSMLINDIASCAVVRAELIDGAYHRSAPKDELQRVKTLLGLSQSLPFDDRAADEYGVIRSLFEKTGTKIGANDLMIASIALASNLIVVTHNCGEFSRVPNLRVEDWQSP